MPINNPPLYPHVMGPGREKKILSPREKYEEECQLVADNVIEKIDWDQDTNDSGVLREMIAASGRMGDIKFYAEADFQANAESDEIMERIKKIDEARLYIKKIIRLKNKTVQEAGAEDTILEIIHRHYRKKMAEIKEKADIASLTPENFQKCVERVVWFCQNRLKNKSNSFQDLAIACEPQSERIARRMAGCTDEQYERWSNLRTQLVNRVHDLFGEYNVSPAVGTEKVSQESEVTERILQEAGQQIIKLHELKI